MVWVPPPYKRNSLTGPLLSIIAQGVMQRVGQGHQSEEAQKARDWRDEEDQKRRDFMTTTAETARTQRLEEAEAQRGRDELKNLLGLLPPTEQAQLMALGEKY